MTTYDVLMDFIGTLSYVQLSDLLDVIEAVETRRLSLDTVREETFAELSLN
jgi:hypothetical protein